MCAMSSSDERGEPASSSPLPRPRSALAASMPPSSPLSASTASGSIPQENNMKRPRPRPSPPSSPPPPPASATSEDPASALLACVPGAVFKLVVEADGSARVPYITEYCQTIFGVTSSQIVSSANALFSLIAPADRQSFQDSLVRSMSTLQVWDWRGRVRPATAAGGPGPAPAPAPATKYVHFRSNLPPVRRGVPASASASGGGSALATPAVGRTEWSGVIFDVTEEESRRQQQQQQQQQQHQLQAPAPAVARPAPPTSLPTPRRERDASAALSAAPPPPSPPPAVAAAIAPPSPPATAAAARRRLRELLDCAPHPLIGLDARGNVTEWNRTAERVTGYSKREVLGRNFVSDFVLGACHRDVTRMLDEVILHGGGDGGSGGGDAAGGNGAAAARGRPRPPAPHEDSDHDHDHSHDEMEGGGGGGSRRRRHEWNDPSCEATLQTKDGHRPVHLLLTASALGGERRPGDGRGGVAGAVIIAQDISKQHAALALHRSETEKGIMEWLSHEVRNPLSVAVEASRTLKEDPSDDPEENSNNLELICLSLGYIVELLTDMLDLNKCIEGKITMNPSACRMREDILLPTKRMLDQRRKCVDLVIEPGEEILAYLDRLRLQQVLTNLVVNSMKYTSVGFISVALRKIRRSELGRGHLECATGQQIRWDVPGHWWGDEGGEAGMEAEVEGGGFGIAGLGLGDGVRGLLDSSASSPCPLVNGEYGVRAAKRPRYTHSSHSSETRHGEDECAGVLITVSDSGSGIDATNYPNLFERWERLGSKTNGTGIGLCLCRSLMEVMGGRIFLSKSYHSGLEGYPGCQFCIILPPQVLDLPDGCDFFMSDDDHGPEGHRGLGSDSCARPRGTTVRGGGGGGGGDASAAATTTTTATDGGGGVSIPTEAPKIAVPPAVAVGRSEEVAAANDGASCLSSGVGGAPPWLPPSIAVPSPAPTDASAKGTDAEGGEGDRSEKAKPDLFGPAPPPAAGAAALGSSEPPKTAAAKPDAADGRPSLCPPSASLGPLVPSSGPSSATSTAVAAAPSRRPTNDPFENTCLQGKFRVLVVDDECTFRKMFTRRMRRMLPQATVDESPSGEDAVEKAKENTYDLITMDHFMALDGLNGAETIRALRANKCDACIVGISGNTKTAHHLEAGADDFIRKPVPVDRRLLRRLVSKMSPPAQWRVLVADDCNLNLKFMHRKLVSVSSPHYTGKKDAEKRWQFTLKRNGEDAMESLRAEWYDLVVLDQHMGPGAKGTDVADFVRSGGAVNPDAIVVINTGSELKLGPTADNPSVSASSAGGAAALPSFNFQWTKPAPSVENIRQDLCLELVKEKSPSAMVGSFPKLARKSSLGGDDPGGGRNNCASVAGSVGSAASTNPQGNLSVGGKGPLPSLPAPSLEAQSDANGDASVTGMSLESAEDESPPSRPGGGGNHEVVARPGDGAASAAANGVGGQGANCASRLLPRESLILQKLYDELGDISEFQDMCKLFIANVPGQMDTIDRLIAEFDWSRLAAVLHTLKGTTQVFHLDSCTALMRPMHELCQSLAARDAAERERGRLGGAASARPAAITTSATDAEVERMRRYAAQQRLGLGHVVGVCRGVLSAKDGD